MNYTETTEWYPIQLPSMGRWYGNALPEGKVEITPWTVAQEEMLARRLTGDSKDPSHNLIRGNTRFTPGFAYEDLLMTDQFFLLLQLRCISFLAFMTLPHQCEKCREIEHVEVELPQITVKTAEPEDPDEPFEVTLPKTGKKVALRFQRIGDIIAADNYVEQSVVKNDDDRRKFLYARQITALEGQSLPVDEARDFITSLPLLDLNAIVRTCDRHSTGFRGTYTVECSNCHAPDMEWVPPIHEDFFRPKPTDIDRAMQLAELDRKSS